MSNKSIKISENCWKHTNQYGDCIYTITSDPYSGYHREDGPAIEFVGGHKVWYNHNQLINVNSQEEFELYLKNLIFV